MNGSGFAREDELEVRLLGPLEVLRNGSLVQFGGPKPRALLVSLALEPRSVVSVDRLVEHLWPEERPDTAAHAVQVYVSQLRGALGPATIATRTPGYSLEIAADCVDADRFASVADAGRAAFERGDFEAAGALLRDALALWRGPALADFRYEPFAQTEIARLEELRLAALEMRLDADLALGRHEQVLGELEALVESQPLRERSHGQLMLALYRSGRQSDALAAYRRARATLVDDIGIEPGPELRELQNAILRQDTALLVETKATSAMQYRRLVTVLVAGVNRSIEALDPEASESVWRRCSETIAAAVTRHGGTLESNTVDGVTAAFGIPVSHEDDALRAARAALDICAIEMDVAVGIETGEVLTAPGDARRHMVAGDIVRTAAALARSARANEAVVGTAAARWIEHAAVLDPLVEPPPNAFRLVEISPTAPAFVRRLDALFVGRRKDLGVLSRALTRVVESASAQAVLVVGPAGVGKSRLVAEFANRSNARALFGRCLSYGDGITYWPIREILEQAGESDERRALLVALESDPPPAVAELALAFRRFCEALAREQPLVLAFDDLHWAEPTLLELVEHTADASVGSVLVVCTAREELLEDRPDFLGTDRLVLGSLSEQETVAVLAGLGGGALDANRRGQIVEAAEGNPLFLEQLFALAVDGAEHTLPETIQTLLAARLDRLDPGERAVLERAAVVGRDFTVVDVAFLLDQDATSQLAALANRGFVRPRGEHAFGFRHALVQEAVYRAAPKRLRAELHSRFAGRLDERGADLPELDELAGYHLEQAHRLRVEVRELDERTHTLARQAGRRLGSAGMRALKRGDMYAASNLLNRSTALLAPDDPRRSELLCEFALVRVAADDLGGAEEALAEAGSRARSAGDNSAEVRARMELEYIRLRSQPQRPADDLLRAAVEAIPVFEYARNRRALGRAWLLAGFVHGGYHGNHVAWEDAAERAFRHYRAVGWPTSTCVGEIAAALYWGPTHVDDAVRRCESLLADGRLDLQGHAYANVFLAGLIAQRHEFDHARELATSAESSLQELGLQAAIETYCSPVRGDIELLAGRPAAAEQIFRELCEALERAGDFSHLASRASDLADALAEQGRLAEAEEWTRVAEQHAAADDRNAQIMWRVVRARIETQAARPASAVALAHEAVELATSTDDLNRGARARLAVAEALVAAGENGGARAAATYALELYECKGNLVGAAHARSLRAAITPT
jgi:DNA-binding SARP family transcriptional activator